MIISEWEDSNTAGKAKDAACLLYICYVDKGFGRLLLFHLRGK